MAGFTRRSSMRYIYWARTRTGRLFIIFLALAVFFFLLALDALRYFPLSVSEIHSLWLPWLLFGFSAFVALMFLSVGALVWLYARDRLVATLLFCFSLAMAVT